MIWTTLRQGLVLIAVIAAAGFASTAPAADPPAKLITEKEYRDYGKALETAVREKDPAAVSRLIPMIDLFETAIADLELPPNMKVAVMAGAKKAQNNFSEQIVKEIKKGGRYTLLRVREVDGERRVLMRLITADDAVNYHDVILRRNGEGKVVAEDVYVFAAGEVLTNTFRRLAFNFLSTYGELADKLKGTDRLLFKSLEDFTRMTAAFHKGNAKEALAIYRRLPADLQKDKAVQLVAIASAQNVNDEDYVVELERFRKAHPKDPACDFISIDYYILKMRYKEALASIENVNKAVGGDPFLQLQRCAVLKLQGMPKEARAEAEAALKADPGMKLGYFLLIAIALDEKDHAATLNWLKKLEESGLDSISLKGIETSEDYAEFVKSPEFKQLKAWLAERKR